MCGIIAILSFKNHRHNLSRLDEMAGMIRHRGPDDEGFALFDLQSDKYKLLYGEDTPGNVIKSDLKFTPKEKYQYTSEQFTVGLAHRRLSIIDLTASGHQPMCDESGRYWIAYNGEIYNFKEIREELKKQGYHFFSNSDTEVIIKAYMAWGKECQNRFNGMWAFVIWDNCEKKFWISRDRFGVKPLYYMFTNDFFIVSSEIKSILPILHLKPNFRELFAYLIDGCSESHPETFFNNTYRFPAGHSTIYDCNEERRQLIFNKYWDLECPSEETSFSKKELNKYADEYYYLLEDAVKIRLYADVKVGCALSGGLDSSSIVYCAKKHLKSNLITFSNIYSKVEEKAFDEQEHINKVVAHLSVKSLRSEPLKDRGKLLEVVDKGLWHEENCYKHFNIAAYNTFLICKQNGIKVALDGQGADEQLGGYTRFWYSYFFRRSKRKPEYFISLFKRVIPYKVALYYSILGSKFIERRFMRLNSTFNDIMNNDFRYSRNILFPTDYLTTVNRATHWSVKHSVKRALRIQDSYSMAHSIETRQPFMDYRMVNLLNLLPDVYKIHRGWTKYIARIAFDNKLPYEITWRKDKMAWNAMPARLWFSGDIKKRMDSIIKESGLLNDFSGYKEGERFMHYFPLESLNKIPLYIYIRLYSIARIGSLFLEHEQSCNHYE